MSYTTKEKVKLFLDITGTEQNDLIDALIVDAEALINSIFQVDSFEEDTRTDKVECKADQIYYLRNMPVSSIDKVNKISYTGALDDDYTIIRDRQVIFRTSLSTYLSSLKFNFFELEYTAGYDPIPNWLDAMTKYAVAGMYNKRKTLAVTEYSLGDERIVFRNKGESEEFIRMFNSHKKIILGF